MKLKIKLKVVITITILLSTTAFLFSLSHKWRRRSYGDSWEITRNMFSYDICALSRKEMKYMSNIGSLPSAHIASPQIWEGTETSRCQGDFEPMKSTRTMPHICQKLLHGENLSSVDEKWIKRANDAEDESVSELVLSTENCSRVRKRFKERFYVSKEEEQFPIAYAINIDKDPHQILRFLELVYRPHNIYCLHFDLKSSHSFKQIFLNLASCLDNVIVPRKIEDVYRGWYTLVYAHKSCFSDLVIARANYPWKYVITLCGKELPLRTNAEIVSILKPLNDTSSVQIVGRDGLDNFKFKWKWSLNKFTSWITKKDERLDPIPFNLKVYKSWAYVALSFQFVEYYLCSDVGKTLREYMKDVRIPEENIYAMLFMKPDVPGGYSPRYKDEIFPVMSCIWLDGDGNGVWMKYKVLLFSRHYCAGTNIHNVCVVSSKDLNKLSYRPGITGYQDIMTYIRTNGAVREYIGADKGPLFHNRYILARDRVVVDCMEKELARRNRLEYAKECS